MSRAVRRSFRACGVIVVVLLAAACGGKNADSRPASGSTAAEPTTAVTTPPRTTTSRAAIGATTTRSPVRGGTLTMGVFSETVGLDPIVSTGNGTTGATELLAVYDSLMRFDPTTGAYVPQTAESLTPNADHTVWTLTIRAGITFSDGTAYDAEAVRFGLDRHRAGQEGAPSCAVLRACPGNSRSSAASMSLVQDIAVTGRLSLTITLREPWPDFAWVLSDEPGMIPSPTALQAACPADPAATPGDCPFNRSPVGAGPFVVSSFVPGEAIEMARNPRYWGAPPYLDRLRFVSLGDGGGSRTLDALTTGTLDVAFLRDQRVVASAEEKRLPGWSVVQYAGTTDLMNTGLTVACRSGRPEPLCAGRPDGPFETQPATRFLRVRQAIAAAIDPTVVYERAFGTTQGAKGDLFGRGTALDPGIDGHKYDPERARRLVTEAKANGWDGKVRYLCDNTPVGQAHAIAVETMLKAVGIEPVIDTTKPIAAVVNQYAVAKDFDIACSGFPHGVDAKSGFADGNTLASVTQQFASTSPGNRTGWRNDRVDAAVRALRSARTESERRAATRVIVEEMVKDAPFVVSGAVEERVAWTSKVHDVGSTTGTAVTFERAWLAG